MYARRPDLKSLRVQSFGKLSPITELEDKNNKMDIKLQSGRVNKKKNFA